ncbi:phage Gp37/Gp68 family protein [Paraburkholderia nodosa]|uniref:phage Gp37/Gp68 family protein n=1 Tax=Paraburkholderia nodosa TaxID=392320 RepID=UPI000484F07B|nr:phage Gp37/Gp68 family protein [Paraburkholderia nodosa]
MSENSKIEWCDATFNPWIGCTKVSPGCDHCYAERSTPSRVQKINWGPGAPRRRTSASNWRKPLQWNKAHAEFFAAHGRRQRVFCASLADVFDNEVDPRWRIDLFDLIELTPNLDWLLLTKRIGNAMRMLKSHDWCAGQRNVWLGITVVNQEEADRDIPKLLATPAHMKFLSMEPLRGDVYVREYLTPSFPHCVAFVQGKQMEDGYCGRCGGHRSDPIHRRDTHDYIDWVIAGGESGAGARPMHPTWPRRLRDQCAGASVPFLFKQWGEWAPAPGVIDASGGMFHRVDDDAWMQRLGKKDAGRLLDGRTHDEFPRGAA